MDSTTLDRLTQRVDRLERQVQRWKLAACLSVLMLASVALMGQAMPSKVAKLVEAEQIVLKDSKGVTRAELKVLPDGPLTPPSMRGWAGLTLSDSAGKIRAVLRVEADGSPHLSLFDSADQNRVSLNVPAGGVPNVMVGDQSGTGRVLLSVMPDGSPSIALSDGQRIRALVTADGLVLNDQSEKTRAALFVRDFPELQLYDENGKARLRLTVSKSDGPGPMVLLTDQLGKTRAGIATDVVGLSDETGTPRAALGIAGLQLKDKDGKEIRVSTTALGGPTAERWFIWVKSVYLLIGSPRRVEWYQHATVYQSPTECAADLAKVQPDFAKRNSDTKRLIDVYGYCFPHAVNPMAQTGATP